MTKDEDHETRIRDIETFIAEVRGGRKLLLYVFSAASGLFGLLAVFWDNLFGSSP